MDFPLLEDADKHGVIDETVTSLPKPLKTSSESPDDIQADQGRLTEIMGSLSDPAQDEHSKKQEALISTISSLSNKLRMLSTKEDDEVTLSGMEAHHLTNNLSVREFTTCDLDSPEGNPNDETANLA